MTKKDYVNDVRSTSADARYMGVVFTGEIDDAIAQAKAAPDHGLPPMPANAPPGMSRDRAALLQFLGLLKRPTLYVLRHQRMPELMVADDQEHSTYTVMPDHAKRLTLSDAVAYADGLTVLGCGPFDFERVT
jgi:hypothetical protein